MVLGGELLQRGTEAMELAAIGEAERKAEASAVEEARAELRQLFREIDRDGDGAISGKEWGAAVGHWTRIALTSLSKS